MNSQVDWNKSGVTGSCFLTGDPLQKFWKQTELKLLAAASQKVSGQVKTKLNLQWQNLTMIFRHRKISKNIWYISISTISYGHHYGYISLWFLCDLRSLFLFLWPDFASKEPYFWWPDFSMWSVISPRLREVKALALDLASAAEVDGEGFANRTWKIYGNPKRKPLETGISMEFLSDMNPFSKNSPKKFGSTAINHPRVWGFCGFNHMNI